MEEQLLNIAAAKRGDREAFLRLIEPIEDTLYQTAFGIVGNKHDAEDVWQNTVLLAWRKIKTLREPFVKTWVTRILLNEAKQFLRRKGHAPVVQNMLPEGEVNDVDVPTKMLVHHCLQQLTPEQRQAVVLRFWLDLTLEEIAEAMQVPLSTAKTRLYQGLGNLKSQLREGELVI